LIGLLRDGVGGSSRKEIHEYLATHPEQARALRVRFGIKPAADPDEDLLRAVARLIAKRAPRK
jgi:hypothetical protein